MITDVKTIPAGYKQTEIGVIPVDWDVKKLDDLVYFNNGKAHEQFITDNGNYIVVNSKFISTEGEVYKTSAKDLSPLSDGVITMVMSDIPNGKALAKCFFIRKNNRYTLNQRICSFKSKSADSEYLFYKLNRNKYFLDFDSGVGQTNLRRSDILNCPVVIPAKKEEQTAIATALSDTDALIEKLEKLIAKKKAIKQGAMQQLLTGKKRLPGFSGEWVRKKIGEIGEITGSGVDKKTSPEEIPVRLVNFLNVYHQSFIYSKDLNHFVTARPDQITRCSVKKGDVFFTPSSEMPYDVGLSAIAMEDMPNVVYSYHVDRLRLFEDWDLLFRAYIFQTKDFSDQTATQCEGSGKRYVLNLTTFRERLTVYYPTDKKEQTAIATTLSDMDTEIEKLENKLEKYRQIKTGMMQQLLTGKIRLVNN